MKEILTAAPEIMLKPFQSIVETLNVLKEFGVPEESIMNCLKVFNVEPQIVKQRLLDLEELQDIKEHPDFLGIVLDPSKKLKFRLNELKRLEKKCFAPIILTKRIGPAQFEK